MEEELICGLRKTNGLSKEKFKEKFNIEIASVFKIDIILKKGLLKDENGFIFIPKDKLYISNSILVNFILD